eukprot:3364902-Pleurochrysis_carterae.AAC.1
MRASAWLRVCANVCTCVRVRAPGLLCACVCGRTHCATLRHAVMRTAAPTLAAMPPPPPQGCCPAIARKPLPFTPRVPPLTSLLCEPCRVASGICAPATVTRRLLTSHPVALLFSSSVRRNERSSAAPPAAVCAYARIPGRARMPGGVHMPGGARTPVARTEARFRVISAVLQSRVPAIILTHESSNSSHRIVGSELRARQLAHLHLERLQRLLRPLQPP